MLFSYLTSAEHTDCGKKRKRNEDAVLRIPSHGVFCVADGMGGGSGGGAASQAVVSAVQGALKNVEQPRVVADAFKKSRLISAAMNEASRKIHQEAEERGTGTSGSTVVALVFDAVSPHRAISVHAGDSRVYLYRSGRLKQITRDHSFAEEAGYKNKKQVPSRFRNVVTRGIGIKEEVNLEEKVVDVEEDDLFLLCSDGLTGMVSDRRLKRGLREHSSSDLSELAQHLVDLANAAGGADNISVTLIRVGKLVPAALPDTEYATTDGGTDSTAEEVTGETRAAAFSPPDEEDLTVTQAVGPEPIQGGDLLNSRGFVSAGIKAFKDSSRLTKFGIPAVVALLGVLLVGITTVRRLDRLRVTRLLYSLQEVRRPTEKTYSSYVERLTVDWNRLREHYEQNNENEVSDPFLRRWSKRISVLDAIAALPPPQSTNVIYMEKLNDCLGQLHLLEGKRDDQAWYNEGETYIRLNAETWIHTFTNRFDEAGKNEKRKLKDMLWVRQELEKGAYEAVMELVADDVVEMTTFISSNTADWIARQANTMINQIQKRGGEELLRNEASIKSLEHFADGLSFNTELSNQCVNAAGAINIKVREVKNWDTEYQTALQLISKFNTLDVRPLEKTISCFKGLKGRSYRDNGELQRIADVAAAKCGKIVSNACVTAGAKYQELAFAEGDRQQSEIDRFVNKVTSEFGRANLVSSLHDLKQRRVTVARRISATIEAARTNFGKKQPDAWAIGIDELQSVESVAEIDEFANLWTEALERLTNSLSGFVEQQDTWQERSNHVASVERLLTSVGKEPSLLPDDMMQGLKRSIKRARDDIRQEADAIRAKAHFVKLRSLAESQKIGDWRRFVRTLDSGMPVAWFENKSFRKEVIGIWTNSLTKEVVSTSNALRFLDIETVLEIEEIEDVVTEDELLSLRKSVYNGFVESALKAGNWHEIRLKVNKDHQRIAWLQRECLGSESTYDAWVKKWGDLKDLAYFPRDELCKAYDKKLKALSDEIDTKLLSIVAVYDDKNPERSAEERKWEWADAFCRYLYLQQAHLAKKIRDQLAGVRLALGMFREDPVRMLKSLWLLSGEKTHSGEKYGKEIKELEDLLDEMDELTDRLSSLPYSPDELNDFPIEKVQEAHKQWEDIWENVWERMMAITSESNSLKGPEDKKLQDLAEEIREISKGQPVESSSQLSKGLVRSLGDLLSTIHALTSGE